MIQQGTFPITINTNSTGQIQIFTRNAWGLISHRTGWHATLPAAMAQFGQLMANTPPPPAAN